MKKASKYNINITLDIDFLVEEIANMRYDALSEFLDKFSDKLYADADAEKDYMEQKVQLSNKLGEASINIKKAKTDIDKAWKISKPYMDL